MAVSLFSASFYRAANPDLAAAGLTTDAQLFSHFQNNGLNEGRRFSPFADLSFYRSSNPDLAAAGLTRNDQLLNHLQVAGVAEGRLFSPFVDINFYLVANPDINAAFGGNREAALNHLSVAGLNEGRVFSPFVDLGEYLRINTDVYRAFGASPSQALFHLQLNGIREGRQFDSFVNLDYYLSANPDVNAAFGGNREAAFRHLVTAGIVEGRQFSTSFNINFYRSNNPDLATAGLNTNRLAYQHWTLTGVSEYRSAIADPGSSIGNALNIGTLGVNRSVTFTGSVSSGSDIDIYRFTVNQPTAIFASLEFQTGDGDIELLNANGLAFLNSDAESTASDNMAILLDPGTYYVRTTAFGAGTISKHLLTIQTYVPQSSSDLAANIRTNAIPVFFEPVGRIVLRDSLIENVDQDDYYRIELLEDTEVSINLVDLTQDADLFLLNDGGGEIATSTNGINSTEFINITLTAGSYFILVNLINTVAGNVSTGYTLLWDAV